MKRAARMRRREDSEENAPVQLSPTSETLWQRRWIFFGIFFLSQTLLAASYYFRDEPWDERFAWRMFSPIRSVRCTLSVVEALPPGAPRDPAMVGPQRPCPDGTQGCAQLRLSKISHQVWIELLRRGRRSVAEAWIDARCASRGRPLFMRMSCPYPSDPVGAAGEDILFDGRRDLCAERRR